MRNGLAWLLGIPFFLLSRFTIADVPPNETAVATGGFGKWLIDALFEAGAITSMPDDPGIIGAVLTPFSLVCMIVAISVIVVKSVQHLLVVAQAKDVESSPVSMTWAPIHMLVAVALVMPMPSGYSMGQYFGIWLGQQSNTLGNMTSEATVTTNYGVITQMPLPDVHKVGQAIVDANVCRMIYNAAADYVERSGGTATTVLPRRMTTGELNQVSGLSRSDLASTPTISRAGVLYERVRGNGGFLTQGGTLGNFCGSIMVEFTTQTNNFWDDEGFFGNDPVPVNRTNGGYATPSVPRCTTGPMCVMGNDLTALENLKQRKMATFTAAHREASDAFMAAAVATSGASTNPAELLTYDLADYFDGLVDGQAGQDYVTSLSAEDAQISQAADETVTLIANLQSQIYNSYADAINTFAAERDSQTGDSFRDSIERVGWPILGLHWFQMSTLNQKILESVDFRATTTVNLPGRLEQIGALIGDDQFSERMLNRINRYRAEVHNRLLNSRFDPTPASGGTQQLANATLDDGLAHFNNATGAADIKSSFPIFAESLIRKAGDGVIDEDGAMEFVNGWFRDTVFPFMLRPLKTDDNIVSGMVNMGHNIIVVSEFLYLGRVALKALEESARIDAQEDKGVVSEVWDTVSDPFGALADSMILGFMKSYIGIMIMDIVDLVASMWFFVFLLGLFLAFYIPALIMIQWLIALVTWMIYIVEAVVVIPLWGILFVANMGERAFAPQIAQQGFVHLLSILVYPAFLVIGFIVGLKVVDVASLFLIDFLIIGFLNSTEGFTFGIVSVVAGVAIVSVAAYQIVLRIFSLMLELHDRAISWIGNTQSFGENQTENMSRGNVTAIIGKLEQKKMYGGMNRK